MRVLATVLTVLPLAAGAQTAPAAPDAVGQLLAALQAAPSEDAARVLEARIEQVWLGQASATSTLLVARGLRDLKAHAASDAVADFDAVVTLDPGVAEAWHQRAIARFAAGDTQGALRDIEQALKREPRDFSAFATLSRIAEAGGDAKGALAAWRRVMALDPKTPDGARRLNALQVKAEGEQT